MAFGGFYRCPCGKMHVVSVLADYCPKCGADLRFAMFAAGMNRPKKIRNGDR